MAYHATIALAYHGLELRSPASNISEDRPFTASDHAKLAEWAKEYRATARFDPGGRLLALGQRIFDWLNGSSQFLRRITDAAPTPLCVMFAAGKIDSEAARSFLDAPWEALSDGGQHWSAREDILFCPIRRIGAAVAPPPPSRSCLSLVFMAAAPRGGDNLNYEAEETSILTATKNLGLDLVVEESGELGLLSACAAREKPDVIQISCHGSLTPEPVLLLEDEEGERAFVQTSDLVSKLAVHHPRLLFLSACETAEADPVLDSLARSLVRSGAPAVIGWAAPVGDAEASLFAGYFYGRLAAGDDLAHALAYARFDLGRSKQLARRSRDWHLARLYLGPSGGGALATAGGPRRIVDRGRALKRFLDSRGGQIPVASEAEFVGRRREIQKILRDFRSQADRRHAGVLIHGLGRQGKSSLAARIAHRLNHTHDSVVIFGRYDAAAILAAFRGLGLAEASNIVDRYLPLVESDSRNLLTALRELLQGPCEQFRKDADGHVTARPVLFIVDDFEQALDEDNRRDLKPELVESTRALIRAFSEAATDSRLLLTSRFRFTLPDGASDLADRLLGLPLPGMDSNEAIKQAAARVRVEGEPSRRRVKNLAALLQVVDRITRAARGNPGLQDLLFSLCLEDPGVCERCLGEMEALEKSQTPPREEALRAFLENLALDSLLGLLTPGQKESLRAATLFAVPVPLPVFRLLASRLGASSDGDVSRLTGLGLCEVYEDRDRAPFSARSSRLQASRTSPTRV